MRLDRLAAEPSPLEACTELMRTNPQACALFLDVDGTLLELAPTPKSVQVPDELIALLARLSSGLDGALAIVTGRLIGEVDRLLSPLRLTASGVHGSEIRWSPDGEIVRATAALPVAIVQNLRELTTRYAGVIVEPKGPGLAIHYRLQPEAEDSILESIAEVLDGHSGAFQILRGKKIFEVVPSGLSKGTALSALAATPAFRNRIPIMIGDDVGDEPAFAVAERLKGYALRVGGEQYAAQGADFAGPRAVLSWLDQFARRLAAPERVRS